MNLMNLRKDLINILVKNGFDKDNYMGIVYILGNNMDYIKRMIDYINNDSKKSRNDIFEYAFKITNTKFDNIEIVD